MKLDLRRPILVLAGAWNPAIFQPGWIARHVFGIPVGDELEFTVVQMAGDEQQRQALYAQDVGISVSLRRLEVFATDASKSAFHAVEGVVVKIFDLLPHTPISAYGVNFSLIEEHPSPGMLKKIRSYDALEGCFDVTQETIVTRINFEPAVQLNLQRNTDGSVVTFDFNFHRAGAVDVLVGTIPGELQKRIEQSMRIMEDVYGLASYDVLTHKFDGNQEQQESGTK